MFDRSIIEDYLPQSGPDQIAHYTRIGTLCHLIQQSAHATGWASAWATPVQFLNDRKELTLGLEVLRDVANRPLTASRRVRDNLEFLYTDVGSHETDAYQISFSGNPDELGQWRGYASNGMGCSIVTEVAAVKQIADVGGWVIYDPKKQAAFASKILRRLRTETDEAIIKQVLVAAASYMKHEGFMPEMEFRLLKFPPITDVKFRETSDRLVPYVDYLQGATPLPILQIIIGPGWQLAKLKVDEWTRNHVVQGIHRLFMARGLHATAIDTSKIPYDPK